MNLVSVKVRVQVVLIVVSSTRRVAAVRVALLGRVVRRGDSVGILRDFIVDFSVDVVVLCVQGQVEVRCRSRRCVTRVTSGVYGELSKGWSCGSLRRRSKCNQVTTTFRLRDLMPVSEQIQNEGLFW